MVPNVAMRYRLQDVRGYVIPTEERYFNLWRDVIHADGGCYYLFCTQAPPANERSYQALALLGVGYLLQHPGDPVVPGLTPVYAGPDARVYRNPATLPRAFLVDRQQVAGSPEQALAVATAEGFPARELAVVEEPVEGLEQGEGSPGEARITDYEAERVVVETDADRRALLVLTDNWYPGWKATVDGEDAPIERVDYLIRGVAVPAGAHLVEFRYEPASWRAGWIVSTLALLTILAAAAIGWRRWRGEPRHVGGTPGMFES
jgi:Bacterial membrane protein YfhO